MAAHTPEQPKRGDSVDARVQQLEAELAAVREELRVVQQKKREGDESFQRFSASGIVGIALFKLSGQFIYANDRLLRLIGCTAEEATSGQVSWDQLTLPEWEDRHLAAFEELRQHGGCAPFEAEYRGRNGMRFWALFTGICVDENGAAFLVDITEQKKAEQTLRFQARLLDAVEQAVIATDLAGTITSWNCFAERLYGWSAEEVLGRSILEVTPAAGAREHAAEVLARLKTGESWSGELLLQRRDGTPFPAWVTDSPIFDATGALVGIVGVSSDITARKETEEALRTSENRFRTMFDQSPLSIQVFAPDGSHRAANPAWQKLWDTSLDQLTGYNILQDPQAKARGTQPYLERAFGGEAVAVPPILYDPAETGRKGRSRWIESYLYPVKDDDRIREVVLLLYDVTTRMEAEQERTRFVASEQEARAKAEESQRLHQAVEDRLTLLTEATGALISSLNHDRVLAATLALSRRLVAADAHAIWRLDRATGRWGIAAAEGLSEQYQSTIADALQHSQSPPTSPLVVGDVDQEPRLAGHRSLLQQEGIRSMLVSPLLMHSVAEGTLVFYYRSPHQFDDIELKVSGALANLAASAIATTELYEAAEQRAEQLAEADRLKDQFLAMLAHELRNPLAAISNASQVLQRVSPEAPAFHRAGDVIERQSRHMARLVDQLLDVSRITHGKIELQPRRLDLVRLVRDTCEDHRRVLEAAGISLAVELPADPLWVEADPTRLQQALGNLLQNAAKFTPSGGRVGVRAGAGAAPGTAEVAVSDNGIGIPPALLPRLFDPFVQADRSIERTQGGLGLGLALVRGIIELHSGRVRAHSLGVDQGATFTLELPLQPSPPAAREPAVPATVGPGRLRVLIVEDNEDAAQTLRDLLELSGYQVDVAYCGPTGVELARRLRPEIVLCDLGLPGMDGYAVAETLRLDPMTQAARLIAITGYGQEEDLRRSAEAGFDAHLTKPIELASLRRMLE